MKLLTIRDVINLTTLSRSTIYKYIQDRNFPESLKIGPRRVVWKEHEILEWLNK